ncbi:carbohydrate ABC transporter permease [Candidatus Solirubrobacter pratensis]|uniref:carbohydrate ABC transporter permease n=1 Tax=Candidatus Solirubrobacter pratensis TaxID=1298857 RepID=UPI0003F7DA03|nr:sugar ABC transporter permease [Candidatus Solirubrobacter pratensis]
MGAATIARRPLRRRVLGRHPLGLAFVSPYVLFLAAIFAYPLGFAVYMSLHDYFFAAPGAVVDRPWVGLHNFSTALGDPDVRASFVHVGVFIAINVPLTVIIALGLAVALNAAVPFRGFLRAAYYIPYVTASVAVVAVWLWLFSRTGLVNTVLGPLAPSPSWLVNSHLAMPMIAVYVAWKQAGFFILLYLAALQNVPKELYDAAAVDGATRWRSFLSVTVPGVRPATVLVVVLAVITGGNLFTEPYLLTGGGGPDGASTTPVLLMYQRGIEQGQPDVAAAIGIILVAIVLALSLLSRKLLEGRD